MTVVELIFFAFWCFLLAVVGGLAGLVLGNLRLPAVLLLATSPASAGATNLAISTLAATAAATTHVQAGRVNWRLVAWMGPPSIIGGLIGGYMAGEIPEQILLAVIAVILLYSGIDLLRWSKYRKVRAQSGRGSAGFVSVVIGAVTGLIGGLVGLIMGALRMPAILRFLGEDPARATGSNLVVGVMVGVAGVIGHVPTAPPDVGLVALGGVASVSGAIIGARLTGRLSAEQLVRVVGVLLIITSITTGVRAL